MGERKNVKKKPIVGDGQRLHTAIRYFTQGISMLINQYVIYNRELIVGIRTFCVDQIRLISLKAVKILRREMTVE